MRGSKPVAAICAVAGMVLIVLSIINRDSGVVLWMPFAFFAGLLLFLVATVFLTYSPEEAREARARRDAEAESAATRQ